MSRSILAIVFTVCIGTAFATAADDAKTLAEKGDAAAQFRYAEMLREGRGVGKDVRAASEWIRKAAVAGHAAAQCQMRLFHMTGIGASHDEDKAVEWLNKAAKKNHAQAQYNKPNEWSTSEDDVSDFNFDFKATAGVLRIAEADLKAMFEKSRKTQREYHVIF